MSQVYTNKSHLLDEAHGGASDGEDGRGPKMVYFDLKVAQYRPGAIGPVVFFFVCASARW